MEQQKNFSTQNKPRPLASIFSFLFLIFILGMLDAAAFNHIRSIYDLKDTWEIILFAIFAILAGIILIFFMAWYLGYIFNRRFLSFSLIFSLVNFRNIIEKLGSKSMIILFPILVVISFIFTIEATISFISMINPWLSNYTKSQSLFYLLIYLIIWLIPPLILSKIDGHKNPLKDKILSLEDAYKEDFAMTRAGKYLILGFFLLTIIVIVRKYI